jgi:hypothetical protein
VSAPNVVPFVVTNRTGKRNRAGRLPVIRPFLAACYVMGLRSFVKTASRSGLLVCRNGVRTFAAALCGQTSLACFVGALAAAPGSGGDARASPATSSCHALSVAVTLYC